MKTKSIAALTSWLLLASTGVAYATPADELFPASSENVQPAPGKTRAQVVAELIAARAAQQVADGEVGYAFGTPAEQAGTQASALAAASRSREAVHAEAVQAAHNGYAVGSSLRTR
ncbi:MAG: hypothetical protein NVSMB6_17210 [Burkholderiaceae bacterium]